LQFVSLEEALKHFFGYDSFRPGQRKIVEDALQNRDLLIIMPTGGGKSLCFQLPALLKTGITLVVSPLIALMQDQVDSLQDNGIGATFLNSSLSLSEVRSREAEILSGKIKLLYVAPERLLAERFAPFFEQLIRQVGVSTLAIDEAHCISEWGHDFRPEYRQLRQWRLNFSQIPIMALTATATPRVQRDIITQLKLRDTRVHLASFNRPNLYYEVQSKSRRGSEQLIKFIRSQKGSGIVYCLSRRAVEEIAMKLQHCGIKALPYHAGMSDDDRRLNQNHFIRDDVQIIVATIAFGMGINKLDVRFVIHYDLPRNLEGYYQESGRAGRDGEPAHCVLFFGLGDVGKINYLIEQKADTKEKLIAQQQLNQVIEYAEGTECRRTIQLSYFGEKFKGNCSNCDNCRDPKPSEDWTIEAQKFLSCVARTREKFGMNHLIDVLRGLRTKKIEQYGHHLLSVHGIGKDKTVEEWKNLARSLLHQGLVDASTDGYRILKLNKLSWEILRQKRTVMITVIKKSVSKDINDYNPNSRSAVTEMLFERLRKLRKQIADAHSLPPYVIFADSSLKLMAQIRPQNLNDFSRISGVGSYKLDQYGERFLSEIRDFCQEQELPTPLPNKTQMITLQHYQRGLSIEEIAQERNLSVSTIIGHLAELIEMNQPINLDSLVIPVRQNIILQAIKQLRGDSLKTIKEYLGENYSYDEIKLVTAWWRRKS
jgi:ATP-dependent DNA helicase RecQ